MQLPRLEITNHFAQLGIRQKRAHLEIHQRHADVMIKQPPADVKMIKTKGKLYIDQSEAFADAGLKHPLRKSREWIQQSLQKAREAVAIDVQQGDQMMRIENGGNAFPQIARQNITPKRQDFNIGYVPSSIFKVKFHYEPSRIKVEVNPEKPIVKFKANPPEMKYHPGQTNIYVKQKESIQFRAVGLNVDRNL
ncbi:DUF6470 family protein [Calidifontibacillus oryziterrae]|uniref:DUF6470 family protein n=1 Tax=Calidifontibacillus oryziterrae TaxID=1191699 RepID=UPI000310446A|nr:DUF6470 family protein [Calidifontibacillus oryziterrae]